MVARIEIFPSHVAQDPRGVATKQTYANDMDVSHVTVADVYSLRGDWNSEQLNLMGTLLSHQGISAPQIRTEGDACSRNQHVDWVVEIGFLPGVTDNIAHTATDILEDALGPVSHDEQVIFSSRMFFLKGNLSKDDVMRFAYRLSNPLIQRVHVKDADQYQQDGGMSFIIPEVRLTAQGTATEVRLDIPDAELETIGTKGVPNGDGTYRGPLGLGMEEMQAIKEHFKQVEGRNPKDIEVETLAQTWSEHCKHTIFANPIDEVKDGIFKHYIRRATMDVKAAQGEDDICVSIFKDNSGAIIFDDEWLITDKVETHNSPSALDPFGGAITGIVGVNRDTLGFGKGARPVLNRYGFCFADPRTNPKYYRDARKSQSMLSPATIMQGVVHGVNEGGNCSGIPTPQGFAYFDDRYAGKPLVYVGTVGLIPREIAGQPSHEKAAQPGDIILMIGGRVGKDGIHGATFSSVALDEGSPSTAVQIGDPITQKKLSDAIIYELRDKNLYHAITDNGAGGLSSSIGEMGEEPGGFHVELDKVPLKYPGMEPWEIWISESQERMTMAVPPAHVDEIIAHFAKRGVEATAIGTFNDNGRAKITYNGETIMDMSMEFLHDGNPIKHQQTAPMPVAQATLSLDKADIASDLPAMMGRLNICSKSFIATQFDHEVQGNSILKPLQGEGRVQADASVARPVLNSNKAMVTSHGLASRYSALDCYNMAAASIDMAVRHALAAGGKLNHLALCDNFCWCDSTKPERLHQLKQAAEACYDVATAYGTPFISGKDSMFNDFKGYDENGQPVQISVPPTLLVSALGVMEDMHSATSLDAKLEGDHIYLLGHTYDELGGSEYADHLGQGETAGTVPTWRKQESLDLYAAYQKAQPFLASSLAVTYGGVAVALAKTLMAGKLGADISLDGIADLSPEQLLFSESLGRFIVTVAPQNKAAFEQAMQTQPCFYLGDTKADATLSINGQWSWTLDQLATPYHSTLEAY